MPACTCTRTLTDTYTHPDSHSHHVFPTPRSREVDGEPGKEDDGGEQEPCVAFSSDVVSDQQTDSDMKQLETKHKMSLQQMKEQIVGSVRPLT